MRPVLARLITLRDINEPGYTLEDIALLNDALTVEAVNRARIDDWRRKQK